MKQRYSLQETDARTYTGFCRLLVVVAATDGDGEAPAGAFRLGRLTDVVLPLPVPGSWMDHSKIHSSSRSLTGTARSERNVAGAPLHVPGEAAEVAEVEDGAAVAGVDDGVELHAGDERPDDGLVDLVVQDLALVLEVQRAQRLVVPVHLVAVRVQLLHAVPGEVEHQRVAGGAPLQEPPHREEQVLPRRHSARVVTLLL